MESNFSRSRKPASENKDLKMQKKKEKKRQTYNNTKNLWDLFNSKCSESNNQL